MTDPREDDLQVHLTVDDAHTAQAAGVEFARALAGAHSAEFALALAEQDELIQRAIIGAGYSVEQAWVAAGRFEAAAWNEWQRLRESSDGEA
jgi:ribulose bisphosphate carboxylase small subunit